MLMKLMRAEQHDPYTMQSINPPLVSVVMVICNVERFLVEAIESVLSQTFHDFEFIILDYGSTDKSKDIVLSYAARDSRIKLHSTPPCAYIEAKIAACSLAQGRYIAVQDADDNSFPNRLLWEVEFMEKNPAVAVLGTAADWINAENRFLRVFEPPTSDKEIRTGLLTSSPFVHSSIMMRRESFTHVGGYRRVFAHAEDYDLYLRISEHFQCANLKQVAVQYRIHARQFSLRTLRQQKIAKLAAQAAASARQTRGVDPLDSVQEISQSLLLELGVPHARLEAQLFSGYQDWIRNMFMAGEYSAALETAAEVVGSDWEEIDRRQIADLRLTVARLFWKQKRFIRSLVAACHAVITRPIIAAELFGSLWRKVALRSPARPFIGKALALACRVDKEQENIIRDRGKSSAAILNTDVPDEVGAALDAIPSETCPLERRYLYRLFSTFWDPGGDVLEVGPFLGGTTRAIAMGMMHHSRFRESCRLDTCDKFQGYYDRQALLDYLQPAFVRGQLGPAARDAIGSSASFREVFANLHERESYYRILNILNTPLPDRPKDAGMDGTFKADPHRHYTAIFVDGCKSWFSTKSLLKELLPCISPGCVFIYQDYSWFTCFWIPTFIARFPASFEPLGYADQTYAFTYRGNLSAESIDSSFPDTPHALHAAEFAAIFNELADTAAAQQNLRAELMARLQYVASLAYCGHSTQASLQMAEIRKRADFLNRFPHILALASQTPTYTPDGKISL